MKHKTDVTLEESLDLIFLWAKEFSSNATKAVDALDNIFKENSIETINNKSANKILSVFEKLPQLAVFVDLALTAYEKEFKE